MRRKNKQNLSFYENIINSNFKMVRYSVKLAKTLLWLLSIFLLVEYAQLLNSWNKYNSLKRDAVEKNYQINVLTEKPKKHIIRFRFATDPSTSENTNPRCLDNPQVKSNHQTNRERSHDTNTSSQTSCTHIKPNSQNVIKQTPISWDQPETSEPLSESQRISGSFSGTPGGAALSCSAYFPKQPQVLHEAD